MYYIRTKALAVLHSQAGRLAATALLCALCILAVLHAVRSATAEEKPAPYGAILAFAADSPAAYAGKIEVETFPVTVTVNGINSVWMVKSGTVQDVLLAASVSVGPNDLISPSLDAPVEQFDQIVVKHCELERYTEELEVPYKTYYYYSPDVTPGKEVVQQKGENGLHVDSYTQLVYRGEVLEKNLEDRVVKKAPVDCKILIGFRSKPVSSFDFEWAFDGSGEPVGCAYVIRGTKAAGYSAPSTAGTASGRPAMVGHVAVNPNNIPYGSKLFIQSPDGSFIYGYAIAADTGTALMQGIIGVDLFYATYDQSAANGIKTVDIFVLE